MKSVTVTQARKNLYKLVDDTAEASEPIYIYGKRSNAVLISEEDWQSIQETLFLISIPGMRESIINGMKTPISKTSDKLSW